MEGIYIISKTLINLSQVRAIYGSEEFTYFDMESGMSNGYRFNGYDAKKVCEHIATMQEKGLAVARYEQTTDN